MDLTDSSGRTAPARSAGLPDIALSTCWRQSSGTAQAVVLAAFLAALLAAAVPHVTVVSAVTIAVLVPAAFIDGSTRRLPDVWLIGATIGLVVTYSASRAFADGAAAGPATILSGAAVMSGPLLLLHLVSPTAMGFGDVKLAAVAGAALAATDWHLALPALALAAGASATYGVVRHARTVAFGPGLVGAAIVGLYAHDLLVRTR